LKKVLTSGTPEHCELHPGVPRHPVWEPLFYSNHISGVHQQCFVVNWSTSETYCRQRYCEYTCTTNKLPNSFQSAKFRDDFSFSANFLV